MAESITVHQNILEKYTHNIMYQLLLMTDLKKKPLKIPLFLLDF